MDTLNLRDRDAIITAEDIIFRVYGYFHPSDAYICDPEYAPATIYRSSNSRAPRGRRKPTYYKFYGDEGLRFVQRKYPNYTIFHEPLQKRLVGVLEGYVAKIHKPNKVFWQLVTKQPRDGLLKALHDLSTYITSRSGLTEKDFGVFGSLLHGFYHPFFSDLDLVVYGREKIKKLCETLEEIFQEENSLRNEFERDKALEGKLWKFVNYSQKEYLWHQRRKMIYALFKKEDESFVKTEFEPVKDWKEIFNEYDRDTRVLKRGWIKAFARITDDKDSPFIPSIYSIRILKVLEGPNVEDVQRILSYVEEFRMQVKRDEQVYVEGNLEEVVTKTKNFHQITLTYGPRYYEQTLKVIR